MTAARAAGHHKNVAMTSAWSDDQLFEWQTADDSVLFDELTSEERAVFVRLVRQEMDVLQ